MRTHKPSLEEYQKWFQEHQDSIYEDFFTFLRMPSISTEPRHKDDVDKTARWLQSDLEKSGLTAEIWETERHPVVFATHVKAGPDAPTLLFYAHYDVQPVDPIEEWNSDPFEPVIKDNQVYARGAMDNKGQCFFTICAVKAFLELAKEISINIKLFIEGEEEIGGQGTEGILPQKSKQLQADQLFLVDFGIPDAETPAVVVGMRGLLTMEVQVQNSSIDLHSGIHGGMALNPNHALVRALARLWTEEGKIVVPNFYDDVVELADEDIKKFDWNFDLEDYKKKFGVKAFANEPGFSLPESNYIRPSLDVNGMSGGYGGEGFKTVIPASASAKISCRLVPNQDPEKVSKAIADQLRTTLPEDLDVHITIRQISPPFRAPFDTNVVKIAQLAYEEVFKKACRLILCGATVPIVPKLAAFTGGEVAMIGVGLDSDDVHAPNEHFGLDRFEKGFLVIGRILSCSSSS